MSGIMRNCMGKCVPVTFAKPLSTLLVFLLSWWSVSQPPLYGYEELTAYERNNIEVFKKANKSVVWVTNSQIRRDYFTLNVYEMPVGTGTGFLWSDDGIIVTNHHVIRGASKITIILADHTSWDAEVIGKAPRKDLAVLRIAAPRHKLVPIAIGDSSRLEVGRKVLAIGNPFGLDATLTVGVVSALGREIGGENGTKLKGLIQTDAAINQGNSGGPLLNSAGELIGVNTAILSPRGGSVGIGFAIPVNAVKQIIPQLIAYGRIMRPIIGITPAEDTIARNYGIEGVIVVEAIEGTPAAAAGLIGLRRNIRGYVLGDIIVKIDDFPIKTNDDLLTALEKYRPGDIVTVETVRNRRRRTFSVRLGEPY